MAKKKRRFSKKEKKAYWIGVGISLERHNDSHKFTSHKNSKIRNSVINGYNADNSKNITKIHGF